MARRTLSLETKEGILRDLAAGVSPAVVAKTWGISIPSAYNYKNRAAAAAQTVTTTVAPAETATATVEAPVTTRTTRKSAAKASR